ncbi:hypothetical protein J4H86_02745 [Spiractinospora alimapuensis]|uniref:hypothetical protein n=1 Tax=Spiractinospora alimapuensis TaxID=2820884 RepID=UPI001F2BBE61|nr:hypothetical protein [Spiractinospora alimapuensis]QVQ52764.1 hypothetical protein J4H86_02745 [Spiractinospora alimapuensis]
MVGRTGRDEHSGHRHLVAADLRELAAVVIAGAAAHTVVLVVGHSAPMALMVVGLAVLVAVIALRCWRTMAPSTRRRTAANTTTTERLWRIRAAVRDTPGALAALATELSRIGVNIQLVQVHPGETSTTDEFLVTSPEGIDRDDLDAATRRAGVEGDPAIRPADAHELADTTSYALTLVASVADGALTVEEALARLLGVPHVVRATDAPDIPGEEGTCGSDLVLSDPHGGFVHARRHGVGFTPVEFARARALVSATSSVLAAVE